MRSFFPIALVLVSLPAWAQVPAPTRGEPPSAGVAVPVGVIAGDAEAYQVTLNPANLAFLPAWNATFIHTELDGRGTRGGRGDGLYLGTPFPFFPRLALGAAIEHVRPPLGFPYGNQARLSLALGFRPFGPLALGLTYAHVFAGAGGPSLDTLDLAASARLGAHAALALVVRDVNSPAFRGLGLQRVYEPELAIRPLGSARWELGLAARFGERRRDIDPRLRLEVRPLPGLSLRGSLEWRRDLDGDGQPENELRATVGLGLDFGRAGGGAYAHFGTNEGARTGHFHGWSVVARVSGDRYPTLWRPRHLERIDLGAGGERRHVRLLAHLRALARDPRAEGVLVVLGSLAGGWARMEELRQALLRLRAAGKHVYAYGVDLTNKSYFVGSAAERLWLDPAGGIRLVGLSATSTYFRGTFELLGVRADFVKIAEYKTAPEQYTRTGPSPESQETRHALADESYGRLVEAVAAARRMDGARVRELIDRGPYTAAEAMALGLVDGLLEDSAVDKGIEEHLGHAARLVRPDASPRRPESFAGPAVGVVYVDGDIVEGESHLIPILDEKLVGHRTLIEAIVRARSDPRVRALLVRIDSPGGSALASDLIYRALLEARREKPVICSLGDVAASGGYFIAAACDRVYAEPTTVTGSIGIYSGKFDVSGLAQKLGVSSYTIKRGEHADIESYWRPYTEEERRLILEKLRYFYGRFVGAVARGRKMKPEAVDALGRGRVWTGRQAQQRGLVDELGGFLEALAEARRRAGLPEAVPVDLLAYPAEEPTLLSELLRLLGIRVEAEAGRLVLGPALRELAAAVPLSLWLAPSTAQARMEERIAWEE